MIEELIKKICGNACRECTANCCVECAYNKAHFEVYPYIKLRDASLHTNSDRIIRAKRQFEALCKEYPFDKECGFCGPSGCILPWKKRAYRCLIHFCGDIEKTEAYKRHFPELKKILEQLREGRKDGLI